MKKKNLKVSFYLLFSGLGLIISFGVCSLMYLQFHNHIKRNYFETLASVATMIEKQYPQLYDIEGLKRAAQRDEDWFWDMSGELDTIRRSFNLAYIYYIEKVDGVYLFRMSASVSRDYHPEWIGGPVWTVSEVPPEMEEAWNTQRMAFSPKPTNEEEWGIMVSAILPIVKDGRTLALLGVDYDISYVNALRHRVLLFLVVAFTSSVFLIGLLSVLGSHTVLVPIEEQTKIAEEAKERNSKIESLMTSLKKSFALKNTFMTSLIEEMTNPVNTVIETSTALTDDPSASEDLKKEFEVLNDSGVLLLNAMNEIKEISRIESGKAEVHARSYELPNLIHDITSLYTSGTAGSDVVFKIEIDNNVPLRVSGDDLLIKKICHNLLTNAFKYTSKGTITFKVSCKQEAGLLWLTMKIMDTGLGMTRSGLDSLLADYAKMDVSGKVQMGGVSGLGLYIARRMTEMMKGTLTASSEQGKGSVFTLRVPQKQMSKDLISAQTIAQLKTFKYVKTAAHKSSPASSSLSDVDFGSGDIDEDLFG